ncbi:MAG TPA: hypothetical protein VK166_14495 [Chitinophagaceae bacterium]|nr:hypothetical protein [Chitinophagaceae bacterium]
MFIGHFGFGFGAKKLSPEISLGTSFLAAQLIDLLWPFFLMAGLEKVEIDPGNTELTPLNFVSYPFTHSLTGTLIWAMLFALVYYLWKKNWKVATVYALLVLSHWLLDFITHRPDLPLTFSENTKVGLGLWNHAAVAMVIESLIFIAGVYLYTKSTRPINKTGSYALAGLVIFFILIFVMNAKGDPPPNAEVISYVGLAQWIFVIWGYWIDRNRGSVDEIRTKAQVSL